ncbi:hypothetical protein ACET3Z_015206 [Daucus carota]
MHACVLSPSKSTSTRSCDYLKDDNKVSKMTADTKNRRYGGPQKQGRFKILCDEKPGEFQYSPHLAHLHNSTLVVTVFAACS